MKQQRLISCLPAGKAGVLLVICIFLLCSCENDLRDVEKLSSQQAEILVDQSTGVTVIYSDSAKVKAKMITPELLQYKIDTPYTEMQKGVTVIFYDQNQQESSTVRADYAIRREREKIVELKRNVVATNNKGETFKSEELIWDESLKRFYSNMLVTITSGENIIHGTSFWANEDFSYYEIAQSTGDLSLNEEQGF